jgi:hypothetical protein
MSSFGKEKGVRLVLVALTWELEETNGVEGNETLLAIPHYPIYQCSDRGSHHAEVHTAGLPVGRLLGVPAVMVLTKRG